ncbi:thiopeptide-type bacteriocin biosynthesis protein [Nonomuraea jiangxiensis]|uniref:Thiopeptide-type bacteriocin biosynthesis domain-containing protein n=1 Tax=Nonomuraea jiangxiensis TaxID=633440 RepID=A0A1G8RZT5_9ACTN|nr:thiopeptide-type bacteriocin biosynthesis protein [Nonomuraea jiangxiensis]SDJ22459.1 thiopeptide-type bacteriocin biosynthesis domain-containing protein [Nonomuraea jiangxiensis]
MSVSWLSAHLFDPGDLDDLLLETVRPLITELTADGLCESAFFLRHADGGPHIRMRVLTGDPGAAWERIRARAHTLRTRPVLVPYEPETDKYGTGAAIEAAERHFAESSALAGRVLAQRPSPAQRVALTCRASCSPSSPATPVRARPPSAWPRACAGGDRTNQARWRSRPSRSYGMPS